jgi:hypothetical protein
MPPNPFSTPMAYWVGLDVLTDDPAALGAFNTFYSRTHVPEVLSHNPGFISATRFELASAAPSAGPVYLASYDVEGETAAETYLDREVRSADRPTLPYSSGPALWQESAELRWRLMYRKVAEYGAGNVNPFAIYVVGMDAPSGATAADLATFDDFYTNLHLPEVVEHFGFERGVRYQLHHEIRCIPAGCPRFLAVYEAATADAMSAARALLSDPGAGGRVADPGPVVWQQHRTRWRLWYRRI